MSVLEPGKLPKNHRLVYDIIRASGVGRHLSMGSLFDLAREQQPSIGFTTVYRAVTRLRDSGAISEIVMPGADAALYEPAAPAHAHFRCSRCGRIDDVDFALPANLRQNIADITGAIISEAAVTLRGVCADCQMA